MTYLVQFLSSGFRSRSIYRLIIADSDVEAFRLAEFLAREKNLTLVAVFCQVPEPCISGDKADEE